MKVRINPRELTWEKVVNESKGIELGMELGPIPLGLDLKVEEAVIAGRLIETAGGGAWWKAGEKVKGVLSKAKYCPKINALFKGAHIYSWSSRTIWEPAADELAIGNYAGYGQRDIVVLVKGEIVDLSRREERRQFIESVAKTGNFWKQGSLRIWEAEGEIPMELVNTGVARVTSHVRFFNHEVIGALQVVGYDLVRIVQVEGGEAWVVSCDHIEEPVRLEKGLYILDHPEPQVD